MGFGNAGGMRNALGEPVQAQGNRLAVCEGEIKRGMLLTITGADAKAALTDESEQKQADGENAEQLALQTEENDK